MLHSDDDIGVYSFQRVIALTTIAIRHEVAGDLADRILLVEPEVIDKRRTEADITAARAAALPGALGAVLDLVAGVLAELPGTSVENAPRMADFAKVLAALDTVTGWGTLASYRAKVATPGAVPDRGQHLRLRHLPARHPAPAPAAWTRARGKAPPASCSTPCGGSAPRPGWPPPTCPRTSAPSAARSARSPPRCARPASTSGPARAAHAALLRITQDRNRGARAKSRAPPLP